MSHVVDLSVRCGGTLQFNSVRVLASVLSCTCGVNMHTASINPLCYLYSRTLRFSTLSQYITVCLCESQPVVMYVVRHGNL